MATEKGKSLDLQLINFKDDCISNHASDIIQQALDDAISSTIGRLKRIGRTFTDVEDEGSKALSTIIDMRVEIGDWPLCGETLSQAKARKKESGLWQEGTPAYEVREKMRANQPITEAEAQFFLDEQKREKDWLKRRRNLPY